MNVTVFGAGYVGLVQAAILAEVGNKVICVDVDKEKVKQLTQGNIPIFEPGLDAIVLSCVADGTLVFTTNSAQAVKHGETIFIAVGTPPDEDGSADLKYVTAVADTIAREMLDEKVIVVKSTVPVGTSAKVSKVVRNRLEQLKKELPFHLVSNPEFLKEGSAVDDCKRPDRIIIGTESDTAKKIMKQLYAPLNRNHDRVIEMDVLSAELTKYVANCMLATKISFMNEMSNIAELMGADIEQVRKGIGSDPRIGYQFLYSGCGYGGSCFPKDVKALIQSSDNIGFDSAILKAVELVNTKQKNKLFQQITHHFKGNLAGKKVALWGLSFKPNTDDMREASSRELMEALWAHGATVQAYDPEAMTETARIYQDVSATDLSLVESKEAALEGADFLVICTEWKTFLTPNFEQIKSSLNYPVIFDGRNIYEPELMKELSIDYYGIGRGLSIRPVMQ
jgi:UDPglucose 6-dehydrogenase